VRDALTDHGLGVTLLAPLSNERYVFPWTAIRVSPIGAGLFSARGMETVMSEVGVGAGACGGVVAVRRIRPQSEAESPAAAVK
jgi:membrane-bound metal-dependent hydrolase YbcI (DUF457 family)